MATVDYRDRFGFSHHPFDKEQLHQHPVKTKASEYLARRCGWVLSQRGPAVVTGESGVGKTAQLFSVLNKLPPHRYQVVYIEYSGGSAAEIFRSMAYKLHLEPAFRQVTLWRDMKGHIQKLTDEQDQQVVIVIDDAHRLPAGFLKNLGAFMNFAFDSRELLTLFLVGDSHLLRILSLDAHRHLATRIRLRVHIEPFLREEFFVWVKTCLTAAGCTRQVVSDTAMDAAFCATRGVARLAANLLDLSLRLCHEQGRDIVCEKIIEQAIKEVLP